MFKPFTVVLLNRFIVATLIIVLAGVYFIDVQALPNERDKVLINPIFWIMLVFYPIILWQEWRAWKTKEQAAQQTASEQDGEPDADEGEGKLTKKLAMFMGSIALYLALFSTVGFVILTPLFLFALMYILGTRSWKVLLSVSILTTIILYFFFVIWLGIPLPQGIGF